MGIQALHQHIKSICEPVHVSDYQGCTAAIDAYAWLHRGAQACPVELCQGKWTDKFVSFCLGRVEVLRKNHVEPLLVFDGASVRVKREENSERRRARETSLQKALAATKKGNTAEARAHFAKAVCVTHEMAHQLIVALRKKDIKFLVAPYEADAQLAYLSRAGLVDLVVTEDSDSLVYGCKRVLFKMDGDGNGMEIQLRNLGANDEISFVNWSPDMFMDMCILSGCDYTPSIMGLGMKTAHRIVREHRTPNRIIESLETSTKFTLPEGFVESFWRARATFRHMRVYDPQTRENVTLTPITEVVQQRFAGDLSFLGPHLPSFVAQDIAGGFVHPKTHRSWDDDNDNSNGDCRRTAAASTGGADEGAAAAAGRNTATALDLTPPDEQNDAYPHLAAAAPYQSSSSSSSFLSEAYPGMADDRNERESGSGDAASASSRMIPRSQMSAPVHDSAAGKAPSSDVRSGVGVGAVQMGGVTLSSESFFSPKVSEALDCLHKRRADGTTAGGGGGGSLQPLQEDEPYDDHSVAAHATRADEYWADDGDEGGDSSGHRHHHHKRRATESNWHSSSSSSSSSSSAGSQHGSILLKRGCRSRRTR